VSVPLSPGLSRVSRGAPPIALGAHHRQMGDSMGRHPAGPPATGLSDRRARGGRATRGPRRRARAGVGQPPVQEAEAVRGQRRRHRVERDPDAAVRQRLRAHHRDHVVRWLEPAVVEEHGDIPAGEGGVGAEQDADVDHPVDQRATHEHGVVEGLEVREPEAVPLGQPREAAGSHRALRRPPEDEPVRARREVADRAQVQRLRHVGAHRDHVLVRGRRRCEHRQTPRAELGAEVSHHGVDVDALDLRARRDRVQRRAGVLGHDVHQAPAQRGQHQLARVPDRAVAGPPRPRPRAPGRRSRRPARSPRS
jgi:hypothetical protein